AISAYEKALAEDNTQGQWWYELGQLRMDAGRTRDAVQALARATVLGEGEAAKARWLIDAHRVQGDAHRTLGERQAAIDHYKRYLELAPPTSIDLREVREHLMDLGASPR